MATRSFEEVDRDGVGVELPDEAAIDRRQRVVLAAGCEPLDVWWRRLLVDEVEDVFLAACGFAVAEDGRDAPGLGPAAEAGRTVRDVERTAHDAGEGVESRMLKGEFDGAVAAHGNSGDSGVDAPGLDGEVGGDVAGKVDRDRVLPLGMGEMPRVCVIGVADLRDDDDEMCGGSEIDEW